MLEEVSGLLPPDTHIGMSPPTAPSAEVRPGRSSSFPGRSGTSAARANL